MTVNFLSCLPVDVAVLIHVVLGRQSTGGSDALLSTVEPIGTGERFGVAVPVPAGTDCAVQVHAGQRGKCWISLRQRGKRPINQRKCVFVTDQFHTLHYPTNRLHSLACPTRRTDLFYSDT